ncbi:MAG: glucose 1-dehydrogenase [Deltaproteobacteria bacterium]|nr:glucose 1-dehydrogenase [Deltaproteobacteria bacterium]MBW1943637.1 glucose 1-dehydrogenase [Deltaproteobacteria bacterium]MBW2207585.1 glucose 1-dehydrogenase [Deltaproteobacteria bacterium]
MKRPELTLENKIALITGASGGIGGAIAKVFGAAGAKVFLHGTSEEKLKKLSGELDTESIPNAYKAIDINISGAAQELVDAVVNEMGTIDILVNAAGINRPQKPEEVTEENWDDVMNINLKALFFVSQAAGKIMIERGGGKIVNISSQAGVVALPLRAAYCSSKGGVNQLTRALALEWAEHNISVNAVAPTFVQTPFTESMFKDEDFKKYVLDSIPMRRMATLEEVANTTLFFASDLADIVTGQILPVDGGWTIK